MYYFNEIEKHILEQIITLKGNEAMFSNFIIGKVNRSLIEVLPKEKKATMILHHYMGSFDDNKGKYKKVYQQNMELLCTAVKLLKYLEKENLIYDYGIFSDDKLENKFHLGFHPEPHLGGVKWEIEDNEIVNDIIFLSRRVFLPTSSLIEIVNNKYKSFEEIKFSKQMKATWVSIFVAIVFGLYGIFK